MLKFAILQKVENNGKTAYRPILEGEDGEFVRELTSRVGRILGPKRNIRPGEVSVAIEKAFEEYKMEFKERTVRIP